MSVSAFTHTTSVPTATTASAGPNWKLAISISKDSVVVSAAVVSVAPPGLLLTALIWRALLSSAQAVSATVATSNSRASQERFIVHLFVRERPPVRDGDGTDQLDPLRGRQVLVLEQALVQLAGRVAGQLGAEVDGARTLDVGEVAPAVADQLGSQRRRLGVVDAASSTGCTTALTSSPNSSLGTPNTATSTTLSWVMRTFSASWG